MTRRPDGGLHATPKMSEIIRGGGAICLFIVALVFWWGGGGRGVLCISIGKLLFRYILTGKLIFLVF